MTRKFFLLHRHFKLKVLPSGSALRSENVIVYIVFYKQVTKKEPRDDNLASDISPSERTDDVTPQLDCHSACENTSPMSADTTMTNSDVDDDLQSHSTGSSSEEQLSNVQPWLIKKVK